MSGQFEVTHGHSIGGKRSRTYKSWECMKARCNNPNDPFFHLYGGRGIKVCKQWTRFEDALKGDGDE